MSGHGLLVHWVPMGSQDVLGDGQKKKRRKKKGKGNSGKLFISFDVFSRVRGGQESFKITEKTMKLGRARGL